MAESLVSQRKLDGKAIFEKIGRLYTDLDETQMKLNIAINEMARLGRENKELTAKIEKLKGKKGGKKSDNVRDINPQKE